MKFLAAIVLILSSLNASAARVSFVATLSPAGSFTAVNTSVQGSAKQLPDGSVSADNVQIKMNQFKTGIELRDKHTAEHLQVEKFPTGELVFAKGKNGKGAGKIRIMGKQQPVSGEYEIKDKILVAHFIVKISDFGIGRVKYLGVGVKDEIQVTVEIPVVSK